LWLKQGDKTAARRAFEDALKIEPSDVTAAHSLFELQLDAGELPEAARTLQIMQTHQPGANTLAAEILLLIRREDQAAAIRTLETLSGSMDPDPWAMDTAVNALDAAGWGAAALKVLQDTLKRTSCNPQTAAAAIRLLNARRKHFAAIRLFARLKDGELQRRAGAPLIEGLANSKPEGNPIHYSLALRWLMWRRRAALTSDDAAWGQVGYALIRFGRMRKTVEWLSDWRTRPAAQPWMLFNLCLALRTAGRYAESLEVTRHVLKSWAHRPGSADLNLFMAVEEALTGSLEQARTYLGRTVVRENVAYDLNLFLVAKTVIEFRDVPPEARHEQFKIARRALATRLSAGKLLFAGLDVRRTFKRAGQLFAREGAGGFAPVWLFWKLHWQWALIPLAVTRLLFFLL
jgi:tetratricopeptide (TPR) repeat protein